MTPRSVRFLPILARGARGTAPGPPVACYRCRLTWPIVVLAIAMIAFVLLVWSNRPVVHAALLLLALGVGALMRRRKSQRSNGSGSGKGLGSRRTQGRLIT